MLRACHSHCKGLILFFFFFFFCMATVLLVNNMTYDYIDWITVRARRDLNVSTGP